MTMEELATLCPKSFVMTDATLVRQIVSNKDYRLLPKVYARWLDKEGRLALAAHIVRSVDSGIVERVSGSLQLNRPFTLPDDLPEGKPVLLITQIKVVSGERHVLIGTHHKTAVGTVAFNRWLSVKKAVDLTVSLADVTNASLIAEYLSKL